MSEIVDYSADELQSQLETLQIPSNIDPRLLEIWIQREQAAIDKKKQRYKPPTVRSGRKLSLVFAAVIGVGVMCLSIILGLVQGKETAEILPTTCEVFLFYTIAGYVAGIIAELCVTDSVETILREIVKRTRGEAQEVPETSGE
ncbi:hypothetical protein FACS1894170_00560 [Planctomycetales bacterium]|nr:hypothetical protein FACS1894170_00560 [Planctomycetales bacterium]